MKKLFSILLVVSIMLTSALPAHAQGEVATQENAILSEMSEEEVMKFLSDNGIVVPEDFAGSTAETVRIVRIWMERVEANPNTVFSYSLQSTYEFACQVRDAVNAYYGIDETVSAINVLSASYTLQDSTYYEWTDDMWNYNCYSYAIRDTSGAYNPGHFSGQSLTQDEANDITAYILALRTKADLEAKGYSSVTITTTQPSYSSSQSAICVRKGYEIGTGLGDYHYMRVWSGNVWRHKPGLSAVLQYNYLPTTSRDWTNECIYDYDDIYEATIVYTNTIYYIVYSN